MIHIEIYFNHHDLLWKRLATPLCKLGITEVIVIVVMTEAVAIVVLVIMLVLVRAVVAEATVIAVVV